MSEVQEETGSMSGPAYRVEVRSSGLPFEDCYGNLVGQEFRPIDVFAARLPHGVKTDVHHQICATQSYLAAMAHAYTWLANNNFSGEARVTKYQIEIQHKVMRSKDEPVVLNHWSGHD